MAEPGSLCSVGNGSSSFSGDGSSGDFIAVSQSKKATINIYQWGKSQTLYQSHIQEISTCLASDKSGLYIVSGSKKGWLYFWEIANGNLLNSWQAHFKSVTRVAFTKCGNYCVSASEDGMIKVWELTKIVDQSDIIFLNQVDGKPGALSRRKDISPYRSFE